MRGVQISVMSPSALTLSLSSFFLFLYDPTHSSLFPISTNSLSLYSFSFYYCSLLIVVIVMVRDDLYVTVPSFFRCPISLDVMKSPVSLSTGVTYDRSSIQKWLDNGNNTCPATMQVLQSKEFVPNHTLHRLIQIWSTSSQLDRVDSSPSLSRDQAQFLLKVIDGKPASDSLDSLKKLASFVQDSSENRQFLAKQVGFSRIIGQFLGNAADVHVAEQVVRILSAMVNNEHSTTGELVETVSRMYREFSSTVILVLRQQSTTSDSKVASATLLKRITEKRVESNLVILENDDVLLPELIKLINPETDLTLLEEILCSLVLLTAPKKVKVKAVQLGAISALSKLLSSENKARPACTEKVLKLMETVSYCKEARNEICGEGSTVVSDILGKVLKVSKAATEHAVKILWNVCYVYRDERAQEVVAMNNGVTKILLLMQSDCSPMVQLMSNDLLKIFRVYSKSCLSGYDTKVSNIMPF